MKTANEMEASVTIDRDIDIFDKFNLFKSDYFS